MAASGDCRVEGGAMTRRRGLFAPLSRPYPTVWLYWASWDYSWSLYYLPF